jgi:hypothetical protein
MREEKGGSGRTMPNNTTMRGDDGKLWVYVDKQGWRHATLSERMTRREMVANASEGCFLKPPTLLQRILGGLRGNR